MISHGGSNYTTLEPQQEASEDQRHGRDRKWKSARHIPRALGRVGETTPLCGSVIRSRVRDAVSVVDSETNY
jgi:hypothetical protein